jgi:serine kinase
MSAYWNSDEFAPQTIRLSPQNSKLDTLEQRGYLIGKQIGCGTFATVHLATYVDNTSTETVRLVCKILNKNKTQANIAEKFISRELDILTKIDNPNIIHVHSIVQRGPRIFIFMDFAEGGNLFDFIQKNGVVPEKQARLWFRQVASGLQYLHSKNIAHRDLKCQNILLSKHFNAKLCDFGFARFCGDGDGGVLSRTYCGTRGYTAPEVTRNTPYNPKIADIWSLGVILFFMLNDSLPSNESVERKLLEHQRTRHCVFLTGVSRLAKAIVTQMLERDVTLRPSIDRVLENEWVRSKKD